MQDAQFVKKKLELRGEGDGQIFVCKCGHREKFRHLRNVENLRVEKTDKRDVQKFMKKQEEPENTAMADALKKLFDK